MKKATMTIRVESQLKEDFIKTAQAMNTSAAQILPELMRDFVSKHFSVPAHAITPEEQAKRAYIVNESFTSIEMEGVTLSESLKIHASRFINGELTVDEFLRG